MAIDRTEEPPASRFEMAAFLLVLATAFVLGVASLREVPEAQWREITGPERILDGSSGSRLNQALNERFVAREAFASMRRAAGWLLLGDLGERVRAGCEGWLFLVDEFEIHPEAAGAAAFRTTHAARIAGALAQRGIRVLVAVVPDKSRIEADRLCALRRPARFEARVSGWTSQLRARGVETLDLTAVMTGVPGERYYRTDSHWNEAGAQAAARALAQTLVRKDWVAQPKSPSAPIQTRRIARSGDLVRVAGLDGLPERLRPSETAEASTVPPPEAASDDLFGESGIPQVALVGSSFSRSANFAPFLARHLGAPIANAAREGGAFDVALKAYLASAAFRDHPPKVIVWEIPERVIGQPVESAERHSATILPASPIKR